ncbi:MAG TPA: hypothetical protein VFB54_15960 [Burkholderiales bacterium]|nr:hypothetical protein [Burkholderiales bacterium]
MPERKRGAKCVEFDEWAAWSFRIIDPFSRIGYYLHQPTWRYYYDDELYAYSVGRGNFARASIRDVHARLARKLLSQCCKRFSAAGVDLDA